MSGWESELSLSRVLLAWLVGGGRGGSLRESHAPLQCCTSFSAPLCYRDVVTPRVREREREGGKEREGETWRKRDVYKCTQKSVGREEEAMWTRECSELRERREKSAWVEEAREVEGVKIGGMSACAVTHGSGSLEVVGSRWVSLALSPRSHHLLPFPFCYPWALHVCPTLNLIPARAPLIADRFVFSFSLPLSCSQGQNYPYNRLPPLHPRFSTSFSLHLSLALFLSLSLPSRRLQANCPGIPRSSHSVLGATTRSIIINLDIKPDRETHDHLPDRFFSSSARSLHLSLSLSPSIRFSLSLSLSFVQSNFAISAIVGLSRPRVFFVFVREFLPILVFIQNHLNLRESRKSRDLRLWAKVFHSCKIASYKSAAINHHDEKVIDERTNHIEKYIKTERTLLSKNPVAVTLFLVWTDRLKNRETHDSPRVFNFPCCFPSKVSGRVRVCVSVCARACLYKTTRALNVGIFVVRSSKINITNNKQRERRNRVVIFRRSFSFPLRRNLKTKLVDYIEIHVYIGF